MTDVSVSTPRLKALINFYRHVEGEFEKSDVPRKVRRTEDEEAFEWVCNELWAFLEAKIAESDPEDQEGALLLAEFLSDQIGGKMAAKIKNHISEMSREH